MDRARKESRYNNQVIMIGQVTIQRVGRGGTKTTTISDQPKSILNTSKNSLSPNKKSVHFNELPEKDSASVKVR